MGNRAVIALESMPQVGIYVHWNGGMESIEHFLQTARDRGLRSPGSDPHYAFARLVGLIHEFFGVEETTSLGVGPLEQLDADNHDNGLYWINNDWEVARREFAPEEDLDGLTEGAQAPTTAAPRCTPGSQGRSQAHPPDTETQGEHGMNDKGRREKRRRRWLRQAESLRAELSALQDKVYDLIEYELKDWECDEWRDGTPPTPVEHPLWQLMDQLEDCEILTEERVQALGEDA